MQTLANIGEDELIHRLTGGLRLSRDVASGPGDDCAVLEAPKPGRQLLLKTDAVVENIHFRHDARPQLVGRKAMARVVSDIAAMGGTPHHALVTLVLRRATEVSYVEQLYAGIREIAGEFKISIVGGEVSRGDTIVVSISLLGSVPAKKWPGRKGGKPGDAIFVTGKLGGSLRGRHFTFTPRVKEARWLVKHFSIHAMMDISDGPAKDLPRMARASEVEFAVDGASLPCSERCSPAEAWGDGEDYELLFAVSPKCEKRLLREWAKAFPDLALTRIGSLTEIGAGSPPSFETRGWDHFK